MSHGLGAVNVGGTRASRFDSLKSESNSSSTTDAYLPLVALADYAGLSVRTLRGYLTHPIHALPSYRIGGRILVRRSEFDAWAQQFRVAPASAIEAIVSDAMRGL